MPAEIMTAKETADYVKLSLRTLERLAEVGEGPVRLRLTERRVAYRKADVDAWLTSRSTAKRAA